jgi:hypothetical protein
MKTIAQSVLEGIFICLLVRRRSEKLGEFSFYEFPNNVLYVKHIYYFCMLYKSL